MTAVADCSTVDAHGEGTGPSDGTVPSAAPRIGIAIAAVFVAGLPLVADPGGWFVYLPLRWLAMLLAIGVVGAAVWRSGSGFRRPPGWRWWFALVVVACASAALSSAPRVSLLGSGDRLFGASTWAVHAALAVLGANVVRRRADLVVLARAMCVGLLCVAVVTLAQRSGWDVPSGASSFTRPGGPFGNANFLGAYCVLAVLTAVGIAVDRDELPRWRLVAGGAVTAGLAVAVLTGSRSSWLALTVGGACLAAATVRLHLSARTVLRTVGLVATALGFCVLVGALAGAGDRLDDLTGGTARGRLDTWSRSVEVIARRPVLGWGPEGVAEGLTGSIDDDWEQTYGRRLTPDRAHNGLLDVGASLGILGLVAYAGVVVGTARRVRTVVAGDRRDVDARHGSAVLGLAAGLAAYLLHQQLLFPLFDLDGLAWFLTGALGASAGPRVAPVRPRRQPTGARTLAVSAATAVWLVLVALGVSALVADRHARDAADALGGDQPERALDHAGSSLDRSPGQTLPALLAADAAERVGTDEAVQRGLQLIRDAGAVGFDDGRLTLAEARLLLRRGDEDDLAGSRALLEGQLAHDPARSEAWLLLGDVHESASAPAAALYAWQEAARLAPRRITPLVRLAPAHLAAGRPDLALATIDQIELLSGPEAGPLPAELALVRARARVDLRRSDGA